jgi:DNA polymerase-3 subunit alpha
MGKKRRDVMAKERKRFVEGAVSRGVKRGKVQELFDLMEKFAGYGFNKSHSAAYALIAYWTGYLKAHHPVYFMASVLTSYKGDAKHIVEAVYECRERGIEVVPPDVNRSELNFAVDGQKILFGLSAVKNVGEKAVEGILDVRRKNGRIDSFFGLASEVDSRLCNRKVWESLVKAGAFDSLGRKRAQLFAVLDEAIARSQAAARNGFRGMGSLFDGDSQNEDERRIPDIEESSKEDLLAGEREVLGFYIEGNPLDDFREEIERFATADSKTLAERPDRSEQALAGIVRKVSAKTTRRGDLMARLELEDRRGSVEVLVFPETYRRSRDLLEEENIIFVKGTADVVTEGREAKLLAEEIRPLQSLRRPAAASGRAVLIETSAIGFEDEMLEALERLLQKHRGDKPVYLHLHYPRRFAVKIQLSPERRVAPTPAFLQAVKELLGEESVKLEV